VDNDSPPELTKPTKTSREFDRLETSVGDAWKPPAAGSHRNRAGKFAQAAQLALEAQEFEDMIPTYAAAVISDDHKDGIDDRKPY